MILYPFFVCVINMLTIHSMLTRKRSIKYCLVAFVLNTLFIICTATLAQKYITTPTTLKYITFFIAFMYIVYIHLIFKESVSKKIFTMFSIWMFSTIILFFVASLASILIGSVNKLDTQNLVYIIRISIQILLLPVVYLGLSKPYKKILSLVSDKTIQLMSLYPIIAFLLLINTYTTPFGGFNNFNSKYEVLLLLVFISLGYMLVFVGISSSSKILSLQYNYKIIENQVELQRQNYKILNESLERLYSLKHDVRHHFSAIKSMLDEKKYEQVLKYIEEFDQNEISHTIPTLCQNFTADSIIKYYFSIAIYKNIDFKTNLNIPEDININPLDLCVVLGNCLENAIEACDKLGDGNKKYINFSSQIVNSHLVFKIINSFNGIILRNGETIQSTKGEATHGIGITSVSETVNKYKGDLNIKYTENEFEVDIIMSISRSIITGGVDIHLR